MIELLDNTSTSVAKKIWAVWQASYAVEAVLLNATNFPPLQRTIADFTTSKTHFLGFWEAKELAAVTEILQEKGFVHFQSLVVHPSFFRKGIAQKLLDHVFLTFKSPLYIVETGTANKPAIALYKKNNFVEVRQWDTDFGIRKVRFERISAEY